MWTGSCALQFGASLPPPPPPLPYHWFPIAGRPGPPLPGPGLQPLAGPAGDASGTGQTGWEAVRQQAAWRHMIGSRAHSSQFKRANKPSNDEQVACLITPPTHAQALMNRHVVIDLGHELLNGMFYPLRFQSGPLSELEFGERLEESMIPITKVGINIGKGRWALRLGMLQHTGQELILEHPSGSPCFSNT
jgi:hypothetical protein